MICIAIAPLISAVNSHIRASNSVEHLQDSLSTFVRAKPMHYDMFAHLWHCKMSSQVGEWCYPKVSQVL